MLSHHLMSAVKIENSDCSVVQLSSSKQTQIHKQNFDYIFTRQFESKIKLIWLKIIRLIIIKIMINYDDDGLLLLVVHDDGNWPNDE